MLLRRMIVTRFGSSQVLSHREVSDPFPLQDRLLGSSGTEPRAGDLSYVE
jgi:hypothetical protein